MLRPERMSKVTVTGAKGVLDDVVEVVHDRNCLHVSEYDGDWDGFEPGAPRTSADRASERLVTVRALLSTLDVDHDRAYDEPVILDEDVDEEIESVRETVTELDDRRDQLTDELRAVEERIEAAEPFRELGIDFDLLCGYDSLQVAVGKGDIDAVERAVVDAEGLREFETYTGGDVVAVLAHYHDDAGPDALADALLGAEFTELTVPADAEGSPEAYVGKLDREREELASKLETVEAELDDVCVESAGFLLAAEEQLSIEVQKAEAPMAFATSENAFVAEGWVPTDAYTDFASDVTAAVDGHVEVAELERASFSYDGTDHATEPIEGDTVAADGGTTETPPVKQDNPSVVRPFEVLVRAVGQPSYSEFDPTVVLFLTFPLFFGFMIGDLGYGALYVGIGYYLWSTVDSEALRSLGGITVASGLFTMLFGVLYGEVFGLHVLAELLWHDIVGLDHAPIKKGLEDIAYVNAWIVVTVLAGILHLDLAWTFDVVESYQLHGPKHALLEGVSWLLMLNGIWVWVFSHHLEGLKPAFIFTALAGEPFALGFAGFSPTVGLVGAGVFAGGLVLLALGDLVEVVEFLNVLVNALSYTRIAAVLLAKAGMAFAVNVIVFGESPADVAGVFALPGTEAAHGMALLHQGPAMALVGVVVLVLGHALVLALGITSAGLQAVRLEYVEFFTKFYDGNGRPYEPFGAERRYTAEE